MNNTLDCRTTELYMNDFLEKKLVGEQLWDFLNHVLSCRSCYEELETRFLLKEALSRLENGETIDLAKELKCRLNSSRRMLRIHRLFDAVYRTLEIIACTFGVLYLCRFLTLF